MSQDAERLGHSFGRVKVVDNESVTAGGGGKNPHYRAPAAAGPLGAGPTAVQASAVTPVQLVGRGGYAGKAGESDVVDPVGEGLGVADVTAAYLGTGTTGPSYGNALAPDPKDLPEPSYGDLRSGGGTSKGVGVAGGALGTTVNLITGLQAVYGLTQSERAEKTAEHAQAQAWLDAGNKQLYASVEILEKEKKKAETSDLENVEAVGASINGVMNGITTLLNNISSIANGGTAAVSAVTFGIGAGINAVMGTINGIRDALNAHRRRKREEAVGQMIDFSEGLLTEYGNQLEQEIATLQNARDLYLNGMGYLLRTNVEEGDKEQRRILVEYHGKCVQDYIDNEEAMKGRIAGLEKKTGTVVTLVSGLTVAKRKQGYAGKSGTAALNFAGAAGGAALLAATIGGVAAAAGPIGWSLAGLAAVGILTYAVGMKVKRSIRNSNVIRMRQEKELIQQALDGGTKHRDDAWRRRDFPTEKQKGWFNKLISKSKSGKMTIGERLDELDKYLQKYDVEQAGDQVYAGVVAALEGEEGNDTVEVADGVNKTFSQAMEELLVSLKIDPAKLKDSLAGDESAKADAKRLLMDKMKLLPKS